MLIGNMFASDFPLVGWSTKPGSRRAGLQTSDGVRTVVRDRGGRRGNSVLGRDRPLLVLSTGGLLAVPQDNHFLTASKSG